MKTAYRSKLHDRHIDWQQDSRNRDSDRRGQKIAERLEDLDNRCVKLTAYADPQICEKHDRFGDTYFRVYDPQSDRYFNFHSQNEVKCWLDEHYYL